MDYLMMIINDGSYNYNSLVEIITKNWVTQSLMSLKNILITFKTIRSAKIINS